MPEILGLVTCDFLDKQWSGDHGSHLGFESELEKQGLKRVGDRLDQGGGGARTYVAWLQSLGLVFYHGSKRVLKPTLAGEALLAGKSPTDVLTRQVLKYQFPSPFSRSRNVEVSERFCIRPFRFLLRLLLDERIGYLTETEIAKIVAVEAETESDECFERIAGRILEFREVGDACIPVDFEERYASNRKSASVASKLLDVANTMGNWLSFTQFVYRSHGTMMIPPDRVEMVREALADDGGLIEWCGDHESFQRRFGLDPWHSEDERDLAGLTDVTAYQIGTLRIQSEFLKLASASPIRYVSAAVVDSVSAGSGYDRSFVEDILFKRFPMGALDCYFSTYLQMAASDRTDRVEFRKATARLFGEVLGFDVLRGADGDASEILVESPECGSRGVVDARPGHELSIRADDIVRLGGVSGREGGFCVFVSGGFARDVGNVLASSALPSSAMSAHDLVELCRRNEKRPYSHVEIKRAMSARKRIGKNEIGRRGDH